MPSANKKSSFSLPTATIAIGLIGLLALLAWFVFRDRSAAPASTVQSGLPQKVDESSKCRIPPSLLNSGKRNVELAALALGDVSVGKFEAADEPATFEILRSSSRDSLATDYLVCIATERGEVEKGNHAQIAYLRNFWAFMQTGPTADQLSAWQRGNTLPPASTKPEPSTLLKTPDFKPDAADVGTFEVRSIRGAVFRVVNTGNEPFRIWVRQFPNDAFLLVPDLQLPHAVSPAGAVSLRVIPIPSQDLFQKFEFAIASDLANVQGADRYEKRVKLSVTRSMEIQQELKGLNEALQAAMIETAEGTAATSWKWMTPFPAAHAAEKDDAVTKMVESTADALRPLLGGDAVAAHLWSALFFESANWPELAEHAFQRATTLRPLGSSYDARIERARYLATDLRTDAKHAAALAATLREGVTLQDVLPKHKGFAEMPRDALMRLASRLQRSSIYGGLGSSLSADLAATSGNRYEACKGYLDAAKIAMTPSIAYRGAAICPDARVAPFLEAVRALSSSGDPYSVEFLKRDPSIEERLKTPVIEPARPAAPGGLSIS
jgi:hypothetical protein